MCVHRGVSVVLVVLPRAAAVTSAAAARALMFVFVRMCAVFKLELIEVKGRRVQPQTLSRLDLRGALLMPQVNPGSLHHCAKRT